MKKSGTDSAQKKGIEFKADTRMNLTVGKSEYENYTDENFELLGKDLIYVPLMCIMCVAVPFVLVTIAPRFITGAEVNLFFLLETILGPIWVWMVIKEQPSLETVLGGIVIIVTIAIHSFLAIKKTQLKFN